jgi:hypothetical protein
MLKATLLRQKSSNVKKFVDQFGNNNALLIWPWAPARNITSRPLYRHPLAFIAGISTMIHGLNSYITIQRIFEATRNMDLEAQGPARVANSNNFALHMDRFPSSKSLSTTPITLLEMVTREEPFRDTLRALSSIFRRIPRPTGATYARISNASGGLNLENEDFATLGYNEAISETVIQAILSSATLPEGFLVANASGYGRLYGDAEFEIERAMPIEADGIHTILCPIHLASQSINHWVGVVVRINPETRVVSMQLHDSSPVAFFANERLLQLISDWLVHRYPGGQDLVMPDSISRAQTTIQQVENACGIHVIEQLLSHAQGRSPSPETSSEWVNHRREQHMRTIIQGAINDLEVPVRTLIETEMDSIEEVLDRDDIGEPDTKRRRLE